MKRQILLALAFVCGLPVLAAAACPSVCSDAYLWLDASQTNTMTFSGSEITEWRSVNGDVAAKKYTLTGQYASVTPSGPKIESRNGLVSFGSTAANKDLGFAKSTAIRSVFMVAKIEQSGNAFLLGGSDTFDFHRGDAGQYWHATHGKPKNGKTYFNGVEVSAPTATLMPDHLCLIDVQSDVALAASQLCYDRQGNGATPRRGGKDIAEILVFTNALSVAEQRAVRVYLTEKWRLDESSAWETIPVESTLPQTVSLGNLQAPWKLKAEFTGLTSYSELSIKSKYPHIVDFSDGANSLGLAVNGYENYRELYLTGAFTHTDGVPTKARGNGDVGNGVLWATEGGKMTLEFENDGTYLSVYRNGELVLKSNKNFPDGLVTSVALGNGITDLGGGTLASLKVVRERTATVVRAHPRLTAGLERESLIGIKLTDGTSGSLTNLTVRFDLTNCTPEQISDVRVWRQKYDPVPFAFYERDAVDLTTHGLVGAADPADRLLTINFIATNATDALTIYPKSEGRGEGDYIWVTAKIADNLATNAEIWTSIEGDRVRLTSGDFMLSNQTAKAPHRPFPYKYHIGAYVRQDRLVGNGKTTWDIFSGYPQERYENLTDVIVIYSLAVTYSNGEFGFGNWDSSQNDTASTTNIVQNRNKYHPRCLVRGSMEKGGWCSLNGVSGAAFMVAGHGEASREQFASYVVDFCKQKGLDGMDLDYEWATSNNHVEWQGIGKMLRALSEHFFDAGLVLSLSTRNNDTGMPNTSSDYGAFHTADYITSQAYGAGNINSGPTIQIRSLGICTSRGVPSRRVVLGQAIFSCQGQWGWDQAVGYMQSASSDRLRRFDMDIAWTSRYSSYHMFEGPSSYHTQCDWARSANCGGVMSWGYYTDTGWYNWHSLGRHQAQAIWPMPWQWPEPEKIGEWYVLKSEEDWFWLYDHTDVKARLGCDITLAHDPLAMQAWTGTLDGNGHTLTIAEDTWVTRGDDTGLIRKLNGTVKNLTIQLDGRVYTLAGRWNDQNWAMSTARLTNTTSGENPVGVIAAEAGDGAVVEGVTLAMGATSEIKGTKYAGGLVGKVTGAAVITNNTVEVGGKIHLEIRNSWDTLFQPSSPAIGGAVGIVASESATVTNNAVTIAEGGEIEDLDMIPEPKYELVGEWREPTGWDMAFPMDIDVRSGDWALEITLELPTYTETTLTSGQYPQLVNLIGDGTSVALAASGDGGGELFLTGSNSATYSYPVSKTALRGNSDVGSGVKLSLDEDRCVTLCLENRSGELRISQNGETILVTDKNNSDNGYLVKALIGGGISQLGGGRVVSVRQWTDRKTPLIHPEGYGKLIFDDEFDGSALDGDNWAKVPVMTSGAPDWRKYTSHREDLVAVSNGCLVLTGVKNDGRDGDTRKFLCGQVQSSGKFNFKYGMVEIRAKFTNQSGAWPAMWMMPQNAVHGGWPYSGEIDISERLNSDAFTHQTAHFGYGNKDSSSTTTAAIDNDQFNIYGLEWTEDKITWYINGVATHSYANDGSGYLKWPFDSPFYFILSQQLEGSWVGEVQEESTLPNRMYIDYVRVWQKDASDMKQNAYLWLDASDSATIVTNDEGEVTTWYSQNICGKAAKKYALSSDSPSGPVVEDGVSFGTTSSNRDLKFDRATDLRTVFMVAKTEQSGNAFLLGDGSKYDFHRGSNGEYWHSSYASAGIRDGKTLWNGELVPNATSATMPSEWGLVEVHSTNGVTASQLCYDRAGNGSTPRRGGKDVAELILFDEELSEMQSAEIRRYLMSKWNVGSAATWTMLADGAIEKQGSAKPSLLWVMNYDVAEGATIGDGDDLANLNTVNLTYAEKPVTLDFTNQVATITAGANTILAETNAANLVIVDGMKATLLEGVTMGGYQLEAGGTLRNESDWSGGRSVGTAFVAGSAGTYEFGNIRFTGGLQSSYKVRVTDGDSIVIDGSNNNNGRCRFAFDVQGGRVTFPSGTSTWVENANYRQSGGEFVSQLTSTAQDGTSSGFMLGYNGISMSLDISGGLFAVTNSSINFYDPVTMNIGGTGTVRAKGMFRSSKEATINVNAGGTLEVGSLGLKAATCVLNLKGGTLKGYEPGAVVHDNVNFHAPSVLASAPGASLTIDGNLYYSSTVTLAAGSTLTLPSDGALTFGLVTDCAGVKVTSGNLDFGTTRGAELNALSGTGTIRISLTGDERKTAKDGIKIFKWSGGDYAGNVTVVPDVGGEAALTLEDGYLTFTPAITALKATVSGVTNWCDIVWTDDFGNREIGSAITNYAAQLTAKGGAAIRVAANDNVNAISMALTGTLTVLGEGLSYLPWSGTEVGGKVVYAGSYDLGEGTAGFSANGTYEFATNCTITANKFMTGNTYGVTQTFAQYGTVVVTNVGAGTATGISPSIFAHWGSGQPSTVTYNLLGGEFVATNSTRYALYFGADGKPTLNIGGGDAPALMNLTGLAQGTDGTSRTLTGEINVKPNGTLRIGSGGIFLRNANTAFNLSGGTLQFVESGSVTVNHASRVNLTADSTVEVAAGKTIAFAHPWTGGGKLSLAGAGAISMSIDIPSKNVHDGITVDIAKVAADFPTAQCHIYFTCEEYEGIREAAKLEVVNGVLRATPQIDTSIWVQTDITGNNANLQFTCLQTQGSFYRGKSEYQPIIGLRADKLQHTALWRVYAQLSDATDPTMIADVKLYKTTTPYFAAASEVTSAKVAVTKPSATNRTVIFDFWNGGSGSGSLPSVAVGNYLWVCVRLNANAPAHAEIDAKITNVHMNGQVAYLYNVDPKGAGEVYPYEYHVVPYWRLNNWTLSALTRQHFACYTEIIPFYITVNANGSVGHGWNGEQFTDAKFQAAIDKIKALRAGKDVKLLVGVGASQGNLPTVCANETLRKTAAQNLAAFVKKFDLDGVDFDWEYPTTAAHWQGWCNLVADLKPLLFKQGGGKLVSVAVTGWRTQQGGTTLSAGDYVKGLYQQCDFVNMMSYDGSEAAGHATLALMNNDFTRAATYGGIPNYKICGGQAFYTNHYPCDGSQNGYNWVVNNYPQYIDATDKFTASDGKIYTYNSIATIKAKCARCKSIGGGAMIWANETDVALSHAKSATRAMFSQIWPSRGTATDGTLAISEAADWPALVSAGSATLGADITLDASILRPAVFKGTLDGNGHTITVNDSAAIITSNSGTLKNVTVRYTDGVDLIYDENGNAIRGCAYPNVVPGEGEEEGAVEVGITNGALYATAGAMVNLTTNYTGGVISFRVGAYDIWVQSVPSGSNLKLQLGYTDGTGRHTGYGSDVLVTQGPHALSLNSGSWVGTALYVDGVKVTSSDKLIFSNQAFTKATIGGTGLGLYAYDILPGYMGAFVYPYLADYPAFNVVGVNENDDPLELTDLATYASNAVATVFASINSPAFASAQPVLDFTVKGKDGNVYAVEAYREGDATTRVGWRYSGSDSRTFADQTVTSRETAGNRVWHMSYDASGGTYLDVNGKSAASSSATKWSGSQLNGIALGLVAGSEIHERQWLVGQAKAADPKEPLGGLVTPPAWYKDVDSAAQDYLYEQLGSDIETYEVPAVTVNGKPASTNDALLAIRYFAGDPTEATDYTLALDAPVVGESNVTLGLAGDNPVNAALQLLADEGLTNWTVAAELPAGSETRSFSLPLDADSGFYQLKAGEAVTTKARNNMPIVSTQVSQVNLSAVSAAGQELVVQLEGAGVAEGMTGYIAIDDVAYVAKVDANGKMTFNLSNLSNFSDLTNLQLTLVVPKGAANGDIKVASTTTRALVTEVVADNLYADGFTTKSFGNYRIPSLVSDGAGEVLCLYDVRYGGGDLGTGDGIDIGETHSADFGETFANPHLAIDVPNKRERDQSQRSGWNKQWDIGDVSTLYDPVTKKYWLMGMTGTGLYQGNYSMNDVVVYMRGKGASEWQPWKNPAINSQDPMEYRSIKETIMTQPGITNSVGSKGYGFLEGPGHGFVTSMDVVYSNDNVECTMPAGTLVFPTQYFVDSSLVNSTVGAIYSTDHGTNWIATARSKAGTNPQENCVMELDDGSWYMTTKAGSRPGTGRINFFRTTNYKDWNYVGEYNPVPCQQGSCLRLGKNATDGKGRYVLCHTLHPDTATRARVALVFGTDTTAAGDAAGISWDFANPLMLYYDNTGFKGYNSLCMVDADTLGVLYEAQGHIYFIRIDVGEKLR